MSIPTRFLVWLVRQSFLRPWMVLGLALAMTVLSLFITAQKLEFLADRSALVDPSERFAQLGKAFSEEFPNNEDLVVVIDGGEAPRREKFCDELSARLQGLQIYEDIFDRVELKFLRSHALLYLDLDDLKNLVLSLKEAQGIVKALSSQAGVGDMLAQTSRDLEKMLPVLNEILSQLIRSLETRGRSAFQSPWARAFFSGSPGSEGGGGDLLGEVNRTAFYNTLADGQIHLLLARPGPDVERCIAALRAEVRRLKPAFPELEVGITGELVLDQDEMESSISDSLRATLWSLILVVVLFLLSFQQLWRPAMALVALVLALCWTLGFTTLAIGHLNLLTVTFATMLIGLGVDFAIHFIFGYEEARADGLDAYEAMMQTVEHAGVDGFTGAVTTAIAFWAICFTDFRGVAELGLIAGTGVLLCFLAMTTVLPSMIFLQHRAGAAVPQRPQPVWGWLLGWGERHFRRHPWIVLTLCGGVTLWGLMAAPSVGFDYNLLNLQSPQLQSVRTEHKLLSADQHGVLFAVALADNLNQAEEMEKRFSELSSVAKVESVAPLIPKSMDEKAPLVGEVAEIMKDVPLPDPESGPDPGSGSGLMQMADGFLMLESTFRKAYPELLHSPDREVRIQALKFQAILDKLFRTLEKMGPGPISDGVTSFQKNLYGDLRTILQFLKDQEPGQGISLDDLPPSIRLRSVGKTGKILVRIYPKHNPWDREPLTIFVRQLQKINPDVIGTPIMIYYHTESLKRAYQVSGWYAFGAICVVLLVHFRHLGNTLLALLPKVAGVIWMLGLMNYYGVSFNPANFMALPLILGIGLIFGVHVVHRLLHTPYQGIFRHSTGAAIALSAATTISGFGTLMLGHHQGIASLGFLMTAGVGANLITSLVLLPAVMQILSLARRTLRRGR